MREVFDVSFMIVERFRDNDMIPTIEIMPVVSSAQTRKVVASRLEEKAT